MSKVFLCMKRCVKTKGNHIGYYQSSGVRNKGDISSLVVGLDENEANIWREKLFLILDEPK